MTHPVKIGKYVVTRFLGSGGMGALYLCEDPDVPRQVAIKILKPHLEHPEFRERFQREVSVAGRLRHPGIVTVFAVEMHEESPCLVMEYIPGETLAQVIRRRDPLSLARKVRILQDICAALTHAHLAGIVHRDIKPGNIMIEPGGAVKVLDFGIARTSESDLTRTGVVLGTFNYMAPEQMKGGPVDHRADLFALGAVMYELLSYARAFPGATGDEVAARVLMADPVPLDEIRSDIPRALSAIAAKALQKDPQTRYQDARLMRAALEVAARSLDVSADEGDVLAGRTLVRSAGASAAATAEAIGTLARDIPDCLTEAGQAITTGEFARAAGLCRDVLEVDPDNAAARTLLARVTTGSLTPTSQPRRWHEWIMWLGAAAIIAGAVAFWSTRQNETLHDVVAGGSVALPPVESPAPAPGEVPVPPPLVPPPVKSGPVAPLDPPAPKAAPPVRKPEPVRVEERSAGLRNPPGESANPSAVNAVPAPVRPEPPAPPDPGPAVVTIAPPPVAPQPPVTSPPESPAAPPRLSSPSERQLIGAVLDAYASAMTARSVTDVARIYSMSNDVRRRLQEQFNAIQSWQIALAGRVIEFDNTGARASVSATMRYEEVVPRGRQRIEVPAQAVTLELSKASGSWMILNVQ